VKQIHQQLKKGVLEILVLNLISQGDLYGYELLKRLEEDSQGAFILKEGSLYPILYRLEDKGFVESYRQTLTTERKVPRKYYRITFEGKNALYEMSGSWYDFQDIVNKMLKHGGNR